MGIISGLLSMLGWGTADFLAAKSSRKIGNVLTLFWMQLVGFSIALIYFLINFRSFNINDISEIIVILIIIGFLQTVAYLAFYRGLKEGQVSLVSPIGASWAMVTVILSVIFFKEVLQTNQIVAIILIILGIILVSINIKEFLRRERFTLLAGTKEGLIAMFGWGLSLFLIIPPSKILGWFLPVFLFRLFSILFLTSYIFIGKQSFKMSFQPSLLALLLPIGFLDTGAFFSYSFGVSGEYASIVAPIAASFPLVTIILARVLLKERLVLNQLLGIASIITGLILISI
jgi:drug/metabolite transporter (DMT)-like permease